MSADFNAKSKADLVAEWWATAREAQARVDGSHRMKRPLRDFYRGVAATADLRQQLKTANRGKITAARGLLRESREGTAAREEGV